MCFTPKGNTIKNGTYQTTSSITSHIKPHFESLDEKIVQFPEFRYKGIAKACSILPRLFYLIFQSLIVFFFDSVPLSPLIMFLLGLTSALLLLHTCTVEGILCEAAGEGARCRFSISLSLYICIVHSFASIWPRVNMCAQCIITTCSTWMNDT